MIKKRTKQITVALALSGVAGVLGGCGSNNNIAPPPVAPNTANVYAPSGCVSLTQPIGFTATGMSVDQITVRAGLIPNVDTITAGGGQFGNVNISVGGASGQFNTLPGRVDGSMSMNIMPAGPSAPVAGGMNNNGQFAGQTASGSGVIQISPMKLSTILSCYQNTAMNGYGYGYNNSGYGYPGYSYPGLNTPGMAVTPTSQPTMPQICATGMAISMSLSQGQVQVPGQGVAQNVLYGGRVYLYLNNPLGNNAQLPPGCGTHGTYLQF